MDWKRISRIRLEDIRDKLIRNHYGLVVSVLSVLLILGVVLAWLSRREITAGKRWGSGGVALAVMAAVWIYRVWIRSRRLGRGARGRRRSVSSAARPDPRLTVTDFEPPEAADWAGGRIEFSRGVDVSDRWFLTVSLALVFGLFGWVFFSTPNMTGVDSAGMGDRVRAIVLLAVMPVGFLIWAIAGTVRSRKTGVSSFQLNAGPGIIGRQLAGVIELPSNLRPQEALEIELICLRQDSEGNCAVERTLRPREKPVIRDAPTLARRMEIPVSIPIPMDCPPTRRGEADECIRWLLVARVSRSRYQAEFEVPVLDAPN